MQKSEASILYLKAIRNNYGPQAPLRIQNSLKTQLNLKLHCFYLWNNNNKKLISTKLLTEIGGLKLKKKPCGL